MAPNTTLIFGRCSKKLKIKCRVARLFHIYGDGEKQNRLWPLLIKAAKEGKDFNTRYGPFGKIY